MDRLLRRRGAPVDLPAPVRQGGTQAAPDRAGIDAFADSAGIGVIWLDGERVVVGANQSAHTLLGRQPPALEGLTVLGVFLDHRVDELLARAGRERAEMELTNLDEPQRTLLLAAEPRTAGWLLTIHDVSELRRLQRIRSEFVDNLAHELRTPLTTIRLLTETLRDSAERDELPERVRERLATLDVETGHLVQMVNELLDLSRIESGASRLRLDTVDMGAVIAGTVARLRTFADRQQVQLAVELPSETPLDPVRGDSDRLGQVLVNLLHNAIKFSPPGTSVTVRAAPRDGQLAVSVADQGIGIPRADRERVFERFYKADKARERGPGGTGLGLAIARHIVEAHGGRIWVDSEEGRGATLTFSLPLPERPSQSP